MNNVLFVNCCIRRENSRSLKIARHFIDSLDKENYHVEEICLMDEGLQYLSEGFFDQRERLLGAQDLGHTRFRYAHQFATADKIIIAAPFWDLSFPALLKVYIENLCVEGITFGCDETGCFGTCKPDNLVYITTRGGIYKDSPLEMGAKYIEAMCTFFGIENFECVEAEGIDIYGIDSEAIIADAMKKAEKIAQNF